MTHFDDQISRIKQKLPAAKNAAGADKVFGASSHKYILHTPAEIAAITSLEQEYGIQLPDAYKAFLLNIGNGGTGYEASAAGPFYGIYPLGKGLHELPSGDIATSITNSCRIYPGITDEYWASLVGVIDEDESLSDEAYDAILSKAYGGILPLGSQGCTYFHGIILNGPYTGKVVNMDTDRQKPNFTFETNFLDWYERWLDEIIAGDLQQDQPFWFGYCMGGTEPVLLNRLLSATGTDEQENCLRGLQNKHRLENSTLDIIEKNCQENGAIQRVALQVLTKFDYTRARPYLEAYLSTALLPVFSFVYWYARDKSMEWLPAIKAHIGEIKDEETFRFCTYLLAEMNIDYSSLIIPFTTHAIAEIRVTAFYTLAKLKNKATYIDSFITGLMDDSISVVRTALQSLSGIKDKKLLPYYQQIALRFPEEQDYVLSNLKQRLTEYGLSIRDIKEMDTDTDTTRKKWFRLKK